MYRPFLRTSSSPAASVAGVLAATDGSTDPCRALVPGSAWSDAAGRSAPALVLPAQCPPDHTCPAPADAAGEACPEFDKKQVTTSRGLKLKIGRAHV